MTRGFDALMQAMAEKDAPAPAVRVSLDRVYAAVDLRRPQLWRDCAYVSLLAVAAVAVLGFTLGLGSTGGTPADALDEVYAECENVVAYYSYTDLTAK